MMEESEQLTHWQAILSPLYGERECLSMWRLYVEAERHKDLFEADVQQLSKYYPIQYLIGYTWFYDLQIAVTPDTLIPRPETEELVYYLLETVGRRSEKLKVLDLGTGTGCIPLAIQHKRPKWELYGLEHYPDTLAVAQLNGKQLNQKVQWILGDILTWDLGTCSNEKWDVIVSNPPYIPPAESSRMSDHVLDYEPHQALFTDHPQGLDFYIAIAANASRQLNPGGWVWLELHEDFSIEIVELFRNNNYSNIEILDDMQGKPRMLHAQKKC